MLNLLHLDACLHKVLAFRQSAFPASQIKEAFLARLGLSLEAYSLLSAESRAAYPLSWQAPEVGTLATEEDLLLRLILLLLLAASLRTAETFGPGQLDGLAFVQLSLLSY